MDPDKMVTPSNVEKGALSGLSRDAIRSGSVVPEQILKHSHDADVAMQAFAAYEGRVIHIDEATNKRLLRRIDMHLMPVCVYDFRGWFHSTLISRIADPLCGLWSELLRQDNFELCFSHGNQRPEKQRWYQSTW